VPRLHEKAIFTEVSDNGALALLKLTIVSQLYALTFTSAGNVREVPLSTWRRAEGSRPQLHSNTAGDVVFNVLLRYMTSSPHVSCEARAPHEPLLLASALGFDNVVMTAHLLVT